MNKNKQFFFPMLRKMLLFLYNFSFLYPLLEYLEKYYNNFKFIKKVFAKVYPNTHFLEGYFVKKPPQESYAQHAQDIIVYNTFFKNKTDGIFFDIGANHPITINNTYYFEKKGWKGFAFDPVPEIKPLWKKHRKAKFFLYAVFSKECDLGFIIGGKGWDTVSSHVSKENLQENNQIKIKGVSISKICEEEKIITIDYISIDVEETELEVLKGIDFENLYIKVFTIENITSTYGSSIIRKYMQRKGYILFARIFENDDIYVHKDFYQNQPIWILPEN